MNTLPFALQLYSVRDHMERDPAEALRGVKKAGFDHVELAGTAGMAPDAFAELLADVGLVAVSAHIPYDDCREDFDAVLAGLQALGLSEAVIPWLDPSDDPERWRERAATLNDFGARFRDAGIRLAYHNHDHEFEQAGDRRIFDILVGETLPQNLAIQLDAGWSTFAGVDSPALIRQHAGRMPSIHLKQFQRDADGAPYTSELEDGIIDWEPIVAAAKESGVAWFIVEQDDSRTDSLQSAARNAAFMRSLQA